MSTTADAVLDPYPTETSRPLLALAPESQDLLFRDARSANAFGDEPVSDAQVQAIYDLVKYGPTALNTQPLRVLLVRSPQARVRLVQHLSEGNQTKTLTAPLVAVLGYDVDFHDQLPTVFPHFPGAREIFAEEASRHTTGRDNAFLQAGYFLLGVRAAGLAAGPMGGFDAAGVDAEFFPDGRTKSVLVVNIGRPAPDAWFDRLPRLGYDDVVRSV